MAEEHATLLVAESVDSMCFDGFGGMAVNSTHTLLALVVANTVAVHVVRAACALDTPRRVIRTGLSCSVVVLCFVEQDVGEDTLLIADVDGSGDITEVTATGVPIRTLRTPYVNIRGIAYDRNEKVIALADCLPPNIQVMKYKPWTVVCAIDLPEGFVHGVHFTSDGTHVVVADYATTEVTRYDASSGAFVSHVATHMLDMASWVRLTFSSRMTEVLWWLASFHVQSRKPRCSSLTSRASRTERYRSTAPP